MAYSGMLRFVAHVRTDVSEELSASFIRVGRICELGTSLFYLIQCSLKYLFRQISTVTGAEVSCIEI
jgi:hypothetical protein